MSYKISDILIYLSQRLLKITDSPHLEAEIILGHVLKMSKEELVKNNNKEVSQKEIDMLDKLLKSRLSSTPIEYLTRTKNFYMHTFHVDENVLIPRPETEILVDEVLNDILKSTSKNPKNEINILEIGIGTGCIFISIAAQLNKNQSNIHYNFFLTDISKKAIENAKLNLKNIITSSSNLNFKFMQADIIPENINIKFDYVISNPPYIPTTEIPTLAEEVQKEPLVALDGGESGLDIYKDILVKIKPYVLKNTRIFFEIHSSKANEIVALCKEKLSGYEVSIVKDLNGLQRVVKIEKNI